MGLFDIFDAVVDTAVDVVKIPVRVVEAVVDPEEAEERRQRKQILEILRLLSK